MSIDWITQPCPQPNAAARNAALERQSILTKPAGSLGKLEQIAVDFAAWQSNPIPTLSDISIRIFAADHGVCANNVSAFPQEVTAQMVLNFLSGGAAISVLAQELAADFKVVNLGTVTPLDDAPKLVNTPIAAQSADLSRQAALTEPQLAAALNIGQQQANPATLFIGGEMGIGNTTPASAIYAALLDLPAQKTVGPGTGIDQSGQDHKAHIINQALSLHAKELNTPLAVLKHLGGFEIAALTGAYISAAQKQTPILVDGFICTAAALLATRINPSCRDWMLFSHASAEPAHQLALESLKADAILDLGMRLGEGSGAAVCVPILKNALLLHANMATFNDAGVSSSDD